MSKEWQAQYDMAQDQLQKIREKKRYEVGCLRCDFHMNIHKHEEVQRDEECMFIMAVTNDTRSRFYLCPKCKDWFRRAVKLYD